MKFKPLVKRTANTVILSILLLAGCSGNRNSRTEDGRIIINYWEKWTNFERDAMQVIVDRYNESQDRIYVNFVSQSELQRKLLLATSGGNPPDVSGFWSYLLPSYVEMGALTPLDNFMERDGASPDSYLPAVYDLGTYRDFTWGLPTTPASIALHYNTNMLREAGLDPDNPPQTIEELEAANKVLTQMDDEGRYTQMGFLPTDPGWWAPMWSMFFGDPMVTPDGRKLTCTSEATVEAFEWVGSYREKYDFDAVRRFESAHRGQFASSSNSLMSERIAMKLQGVWMASFITQFNPDLEWDAAPMPAGFDTGGEPVTVLEADLLVIPRGAKHPEEAWDFIKFVQQQRNLEDLNLGQFKFSPLEDVSDRFYEIHPNPEIRLFRELAESENAVAAPEIPIWTEYRDEMIFAFQQVWNAGTDPAEILQQVADRIQPRLDAANRAWDRVAEARKEQWSSQQIAPEPINDWSGFTEAMEAEDNASRIDEGDAP